MDMTTQSHVSNLIAARAHFIKLYDAAVAEQAASLAGSAECLRASAAVREYLTAAAGIDQALDQFGQPGPESLPAPKPAHPWRHVLKLSDAELKILHRALNVYQIERDYDDQEWERVAVLRRAVEAGTGHTSRQVLTGAFLNPDHARTGSRADILKLAGLPAPDPIPATFNHIIQATHVPDYHDEETGRFFAGDYGDGIRFTTNRFAAVSYGSADEAGFDISALKAKYADFTWEAVPE